MAFGRKEKGKGDMWERTFGVPPAPSYEEKLDRSRIYKTGDRIDSIGDPERRARAYKALTAASIALAAVVFIAAGAASCSIAAKASQSGTEASQQAQGASDGQTPSEAAAQASAAAYRFSGADELTWLSKADRQALLTGLSAYIDSLGYAGSGRARLYGCHEQAGGADRTWCTVDVDARCVQCDLVDGAWSFSTCDVPQQLTSHLEQKQAERDAAAAQSKADAKASKQAEQTIAGSDAASLARYLPEEVAGRLAGDFADYMEAKRHPVDASTIVVRESTATVNAAGNPVLEVGASAENGDVVTADAEWMADRGEFGFTVK